MSESEHSVLEAKPDRTERNFLLTLGLIIGAETCILLWLVW